MGRTKDVFHAAIVAVIVIYWMQLLFRRLVLMWMWCLWENRAQTFRSFQVQFLADSLKWLLTETFSDESKIFYSIAFCAFFCSGEISISRKKEVFEKKQT